MSSIITLTPRGEELLQEQLARGPYRSPEEVVETALETLSQRQPVAVPADRTVKSADEAVADILEIQKRNRLDGLKIKDLIHEGHRY